MIFRKIAFLIILLPHVSIAQLKVSGKIVDANTQLPIPFVNIENFSNKLGTQTNQHGVFEIYLPNGKENDTLKISSLGYMDKFVTNLSNRPVNYELVPRIIQLKEVVVGKKAQQEIEVGILTKRGKQWHWLQRLQNPGMQNAIYIKNPGYETAYVQKLHFFVGDDMFDAPFRIHIYENNERTPGKDLVETSLIYAASKKKSWNTFDIAHLGITVPKDGFWVGIEWIANDSYKKTITYDLNLPNGLKSKRNYTYYGPEIVFQFDTDFGLTYYKALAGHKWFKHMGGIGGMRKETRTVNIDLLVKATLAVSNPF